MYGLQAFVLSSAGCLTWTLGRLLSPLLGQQNCGGSNSSNSSLLVDLHQAADEQVAAIRECQQSNSCRLGVRRTADLSFQRVIKAAMVQVTEAGISAAEVATAAAATHDCTRGSFDLPTSDLTQAFMQLQATMVKKLGNVDVSAAMAALEEVFGATCSGIENVAFLLAPSRGVGNSNKAGESCLSVVGRRGAPGSTLPAACQPPVGNAGKCLIGKKIETAEDLVALLSARVDLLALQLVQDGATVSTEASHSGFADVIMASTVSCSLLKSHDEPCEYALTGDWHWSAELLRCLAAHVQAAAAYHQFWQEVAESDYWLQQRVANLQAVLGAKSPRVRSAGRDDVDVLLADLRRSIEQYVEWQTRVTGLSERAQTVVPMHLRIRPLPASARSTVAARTLVAYDSEEVSLYEGEPVTVLETSSTSPLWRVRTSQGQEFLVPSIVIALTAPDAAALDATRALREQLLLLWTAHVRMLGRRLVELLSAAFTDVVVRASPTTDQGTSPSVGRRFRMDAEQHRKFVTVGQLLQRVLLQLGDDSVKCSQLSGLWNTLASLIDGETAMLPDATASVSPLLAAHLCSVEQLLVRFEDFVMYWDAYNTSLKQHQQSKCIYLSDGQKYTHYITTAHYVRFYNVELRPSPENNNESRALVGEPATALVGDIVCGDGRGDADSSAPCNRAAEHRATEDALPPVVQALLGSATLSAIDGLAEIKQSASNLCQYWLQVARLLLCQKTHQRNAAAYHEFWHEVQDARLSLNCLLSRLQRPSAPATGRADGAQQPSRADRVRNLTAEINEALQTYMLWLSKLDRLSNDARRVVPLNHRVKSSSRSPLLKASVMCTYISDQVSLAEGDVVTVLDADSSSSPQWLVRIADGREVRIPSVIALLHGPDASALEAASRLHAQLAALWAGAVRRYGQRVAVLLREALADAPELDGRNDNQVSSANARFNAVLLRRLLDVAELLKKCCASEGNATAALPDKEAAALQDAIDLCWAALLRCGGDSADPAPLPASEAASEGEVPSLHELVTAYQDFCAYYGEYMIDFAALRQPKHIMLCDVNSSALNYITMAYFPRVCKVTLVGIGAQSPPAISATVDVVAAATAHEPIVKVEADATLESVNAGEVIAELPPAVEPIPVEQATEQATPPGDEPTPPGDEPIPPGDELTFAGDVSTPPGDVPTPPGDVPTPPGDVPTPPGDVPTPPGDVPTEEEQTGGSGGSGSESLTSNSVPGGSQQEPPNEEEDEEEGSSGGGGSGSSSARKRQVHAAGMAETTSQAEEVGAIEGGSFERGEEEEVSYFESSTKEQQVSTEGVMEAEMEVTTTFVITGVMYNPGAPDETLLSLQDALDRRVIDPQNNQYVMCNGSVVTRLTIGEAMEAGYIKMGPKTERKSQEKIKSAAIITVKTIAERYPYKVISAVDTRTQRTLSDEEAVAAGIIDLKKHTYRDLVSNEEMLIVDAVAAHLVDIVYDKNASGVIHEEVCKKYNVHSVLDQRRNERVEFHVAVRRGIIDESTGSYINSRTGEKLFAAEAIEKGFISATVVSSNVANGS